jgi:RNA polymerase sigma factor (sigma-70 family)
VLLRTQPDERLVAMSQGGSRAAFDEIVRRHGPALTAFAGSVAPASRAEDVVQESLLKAYVALQEGAEPELVRAWLFRIVRNTAIDEQRVTRHHEELDENYDGVEQPPQALERREQLAALMVAIGDLPAAQRDAIVQRELEGRGHDEIAGTMKLSPGSVRQLIYRARHSLREAAGAVIPVAVLRAACIPGAGEAVGGAGMAVAVKLGLAAVVATGTIVAGSAIDRGTDGGPAEALQISSPQRQDDLAATDDGAAGGSRGDDSERGRDRPGDDSSDSNSSGKGSGGPGPSGDDHSGSGVSGGGGVSGDDGHGSNSGPGSGSSGETGLGEESSSGSSGTSGGGDSSGEGSGSDDVETLDGSGSGDSGTSGPG